MAAKKTTKKVVTKKAPVKSPTARKTTAKELVTKHPAPSIDAIARAAYLIYRRRIDQNLPGDDNTDWQEAITSLSGKS